MDVSDLPMLGRKFTWCNALEGDKWSRIDWFLISLEWLGMFNCKVWGLPRVVSDHYPIVLMKDDWDWGPRPFKFINASTLHPQFFQVVKTLWEDSAVTGWSLKEVEDELHLLDLCVKYRELNETELARARLLRDEVWKWSKRLEWMWLQKSRLSWALKGDRNTKFFHIVATSRQSRNLLNLLVVNGAQCNDPATIKRETYKFFTTLFKEGWKIRPSLHGPFSTIGSDDVALAVEDEFSEVEVWSAIKECDGNKAPGSDGCNMVCFQKCWKIFKPDIMQFFKDFYRHAKLAKSQESGLNQRREDRSWSGAKDHFCMMEESTSTSGSMIKLNASNYAIWKPRMEDVLYCRDLFDPIELNGVKPPTEKNEDWKRKNRKTIG
ncbi:uncharacterized protein LOC114314525 [Camellia sinensis]|uniref:uncharacterized protein LOC114314525 n=1 Tax=Camellia sinensis TaxID=4442 RepID=UPI001035AB7B|nr:uncharacterized protein LOC114314525 [Camellia sinensis]